MKKVKKYKIPILTDEYFIHLYVGDVKRLIPLISRYTGINNEQVKKDFKNCRGRAYNTLPEKDPLIVVDGSLSAVSAIATISHEASHAMDFIADFVGINDREFHAHGIGRVVRGLKL